MVVTFKIIPGLQWSDGFPLTIHDSIYAFTLAGDPATPLDKSTIDRTASYDALDNVTVQWVGVPGFQDPAYATNFWPPLPQHVWGDLSAAELLEAEEANRTPLGWGPYAIEEWISGDHIRLKKNTLYFRANEGLPRFDTLIFQFVHEDPDENIARVLSQECDLLDQTIRLEDQAALLVEMNEKGCSGRCFKTPLSGNTWILALSHRHLKMDGIGLLIALIFLVTPARDKLLPCVWIGNKSLTGSSWGSPSFWILTYPPSIQFSTSLHPGIPTI
ncbi:MAG: hypothetical protein HC806_02840 [Anaerolineae bacterium]|nr:hypothetical protein [Anaerolineae bacterium]